MTIVNGTTGVPYLSSLPKELDAAVRVVAADRRIHLFKRGKASNLILVATTRARPWHEMYCGVIVPIHWLQRIAPEIYAKAMSAVLMGELTIYSDAEFCDKRDKLHDIFHHAGPSKAKKLRAERRAAKQTTQSAAHG